MSHHFDTKLAKEDPSLNLCDFYDSSEKSMGEFGLWQFAK
jgi:hypothetical protein